jgi:predicted thioesterase
MLGGEEETEMAEIAVGLRGTATALVTVANTASSIGSGDVPVYGTPALVALMEAAAVKALAGRLGPDETTVGTWLEISHLAATPIGGTVRAEAELIAMEGRKLSFAFVAHDDQEKVGEGRHQRLIVSRERFLARLQAKR